MVKNEYKTAIYFSDIVGYSRMIGDNEEFALSLLREHDAILIEYIKKYSGTIIKHIGDAIFAKFDLIDDAINASIDIQNALSHRNELQKSDKHIQVRIGLHEGNVIEKDNDLFGHNVNLCSRIEGSAVPGSIAISRSAFDNSTQDKILNRSYGHVKLKNIKEPIELFRIYNSKDDYLSQNQSDFIKLISNRGIQIVDMDSFVVEDTISLAFLYPQNLGETEDEFFCYSFLEQIINDLQKCNNLRIPGILDVQKYKKSSLPINTIGRELGVENVLQSSIMKIENKFKITIQITSLNSGDIILQKSWNGGINDLKNISGKISITTLDHFSISTEDILVADLDRDLKINKEAYELFLKGKYLCNYVKSKEDYSKAQELLEKAINKDDNFSGAYAYNGVASMRIGRYQEAEENFDIALEIAEDSNNPDSLSEIYNLLGIYYKLRVHLKKAIRYFEKGLKIHKESNDKIKECHILNNLADCYTKIGKDEQAVELLERTIFEYKKREQFVYLANSYGNLANAYKNMGQSTNALEFYNKSSALCIKTGSNLSQAKNLIIMSDIYNEMGLVDKSKNTLTKLEKLVNRLKNEHLYGRYKASMAMMHLNSDNLDNTIKYFEESIVHCQNSNNNNLVVRYLLDLSMILIKNNTLDKAQLKIDQAMTLLENKYKSPRHELIGQCQNLLIKLKDSPDPNTIEPILEKIDDDVDLFYLISLCYKECGDLNNFKKYSEKWNQYILLSSENISDEKQKNSYLNSNLLN